MMTEREVGEKGKGETGNENETEIDIFDRLSLYYHDFTALS